MVVGLAGVGAGWLWQRPRAAREPALPLTRVGEVGLLRDLHGSRRSLDEQPDASFWVLFFAGSQCEATRSALPQVLAAERQYQKRGVVFAALYPLAGETLDRIASHAMDLDIPFLILLDQEARIARAAEVRRTATAVILDRSRTVRFRGSTAELTRALASLLAGQPASFGAESEVGQPIEPVPSRPAPSVTYARDIAPILARRCQGCHRPGEAAPFSLLTFEDAYRWRDPMREAALTRWMPPWHADARWGTFANDRRLTDEEVEKIGDWVRGGGERGDSKEPPARSWPVGWSTNPDAVIEMPQAVAVPAEGAQFIHYVKVPEDETAKWFDRDRWIQGAEVRPGNAAVVHHISVYIVPPGMAGPPTDLSSRFGVLGWAPGEPAYRFPKGSALRIPKGSSLVFELHYVSNGQATTDRSRIGFTFAAGPPENELHLETPGNISLAIPPMAEDHRDVFRLRLPTDIRLLGLMGHMHVRGKWYKFEARVPGETGLRRLLAVPRYDFYWQTFYWLKEPVFLPRGTELVATGCWDNSPNNPRAPDPKSWVRVGPATENEMLSCWLFFETRPGAWPNSAPTSTLPTVAK